MSLLEQRRNDLNHAGINQNPISAEKFDKPLKEAIQWFEQLVKDDILFG